MKPTRILLWAAALGFLVFNLTRAAITANLIPLNDFIEYWSAGRLFLAGGNPYSSGDMLAFQRQIGWTGAVPLMMWNPPWILLLVSPFSLFPYWVARGAWFAFHLLLTVGCADVLWRLYGGPSEQRWIAWLTALFFVPDIMALYLGQISPLVLAGLTGFLWSLKANRWLLAGVFATLITTKPHLLYLFWLFLLLWVLKERQWKTAAAALTCILVSTLAVLVKNADAIRQYLDAMAADTGPLVWQTPSLGTVLRTAVNVNWTFLQFVPSLVGSIGAIVLWQRWRDRFTWEEHAPGIVLLSVISSSFCWTFDWVVLLPTVVMIMVWFLAGPRRNWWLLVGLVTIQGLFLVQLSAVKNYFYTIWMPLVMAMLYVAAKRSRVGFLRVDEGQN